MAKGCSEPDADDRAPTSRKQGDRGTAAMAMGSGSTSAARLKGESRMVKAARKMGSRR